MNTLFCSNCLLTFTSDDLYKEHYRTDFHRYNIARRKLNLNPVSHEAYQEKFSEVAQSKVLKPQPKVHYKCCNKEFKSSNTYETHLLSRQHKEFQSVSSTQSQISKSSKKAEKYSPTVCLFCDDANDSIEECLQHMKLHGFFIREEKCVIDMPGLLSTLAEQVNQNMTCLHCFKTFKSPRAVKEHMLDKGHCFMPQQEYKLLSKFYDFEEKLTAIIAEQNQMHRAIEGSKTLQLECKDQTEKHEQKEEGEDEWEDADDDAEEEWESEEDELKIKKEGTLEDEQRQKKLKTLLKKISQHKARLLKNGELLLPSGKILGHRLYRQYYKQNHIPFKPKEDDKLSELDGLNEKQIAVLTDDIITGKLRHFYHLKQTHNAHRQTLLGMQQNQIIRRWLRKSC